jgi:DNA-binding XRE family transcriptional regulator
MGPSGFFWPGATLSMSRVRIEATSGDTSKVSASDVRDFNSLTLLRGTPSHLSIPNTASYYGVREAISFNTFQRTKDSPFPIAVVNKGDTRGYAQLKPPYLQQDEFLSPDETSELAERMWKAAEKLSDADADIFDLLFAKWLNEAKSPSDSATVSINQLLTMRGLKPKRGAGGRKSGYRELQIAAVRESVMRFESLWVTMSQQGIYGANENGLRVRRQNINVQSKALVITDRITREHADGRVDLLKFSFRPGEILSHLLVGARKQIALLPLKAIRYDPYHQQMEKRLTRYLSWQWRIRAGSAGYTTPFAVNTLLRAVGKSPNTAERPSRIRMRLEKALDLLEEDGVIKGWQYQNWDEAYMKSRGWFQLWLSANIVIEPADVIPTTYQSIVRPCAPGRSGLAQRAQRTRRQRGVSVAFMADQIGIETTLLSEIENGRTQPSRAVRRRIERAVKRSLYHGRK